MIRASKTGRHHARYKVKPARAVLGIFICFGRYQPITDVDVERLAEKYYGIKPSTARGARKRLLERNRIRDAGQVKGRHRYQLVPRNPSGRAVGP